MKKDLGPSIRYLQIYRTHDKVNGHYLWAHGQKILCKRYVLFLLFAGEEQKIASIGLS